MFVIDVSKFSGDIDFEQVKSAGVDAVIIRIGLTGYGAAKTKRADKLFEKNYADAKAVGLPVGGYYFSCAYTEAEAKEEAALVLKLTEGKEFDLPIFYDLEDHHNINESGVAKTNQIIIGKKALTDVAEAFCNELTAAGKLVGVYASHSWWNDCLDYSRLVDFEKWVAHWTVLKKDYSDRFDIWQYSESGKIAGVPEYCDLNVCYKDYTAKAGQAIARDWEADYKLLEGKNKALQDNITACKTVIENALKKL